MKGRTVVSLSRFHRSLAFRFTMVIGAALLIISVASTYLASVLERRSLQKAVQNQAARLADVLAVNVANPLFTANHNSVDSIAKAFASDPAIRFLEIKDAAGKVVASAGEAKRYEGAIVAERDVKMGREVVGSISVGPSHDTIDEQMSETWKIIMGREIAVYTLLFSLLTYLVRRHITRPLEQINRALQFAKESNNLATRFDLGRHDEIGELADWFNSFIAELEGIIRAIGRNTQQLTASAENLMGVSRRMGDNAEKTATQTGLVSQASEQVSKNVHTVVIGTEEMGISIKEIAKNAGEAARVASKAVQVAQRTNITVSNLGESSAEIGNVIKVITSIAAQTNLLALNATIEAARAGEAGKGFAVVANEVKELAKQTARATEEISRKIQAIQATSREAVEAIDNVGAVINQINAISSVIASAVEEQSATTNEISRNVTEAARCAAKITQNVAGVAESAKSTSNGATDTQIAAGELALMAADLQNLISQFHYGGEERQSPIKTTPSRLNGSRWSGTTINKRPALRPAGVAPPER